MNFQIAKLGFLAAALLRPVASQAASIMVDSKSDDTVGQSIVYNLRNDIAASSLHKLVYSRADAGFVISIVTVDNGDGGAAYSAVLTMPPFDNKGLDYYIGNLVGNCGSNVTETCAKNILSGFDGDIAQIANAVRDAMKKPQ